VKVTKQLKVFRNVTEHTIHLSNFSLTLCIDVNDVEHTCMVTMMVKQIIMTVGVHLANVPREFIVIQIIITPRDVHVLLSQFLSILFITVLVVTALLNLLLFGCNTYEEY